MLRFGVFGRPSTIALVLSLVGILSGTIAAAEPIKVSVEAKAKAMEAYQRAAKHFDNAQYDKALTKYSAAYALYPHADFLYMVGRSYELNRKYEQALATYRAVRKHDGVSGRTRSRASSAIMDLEKLFPNDFEITIAYTPKDARLEVDGVTQGKAGQATLRVTRGQHHLRLTQTGFEPHKETLNVSSSMSIRISLSQTPSPVALVPDALSTTYAWRKPAGWSALGAGLVATGVGAWSLVKSASASDAANGSAVFETHSAYGDAASTYQVIGFTSLALGISALTTGVYLLLTGPDKSEPSTVRLIPTGHGIQVSW